MLNGIILCYLAYLVPRKGPILIRIGWIQNVSIAICIAANITKPNIKTSVRQNISQRLFWKIEHPSGGRIHNTVLQKGDGLAGTCRGNLGIGNTLHGQDKTVLGGNKILFTGVALGCDELCHVAIRIRCTQILTDNKVRTVQTVGLKQLANFVF